MCFHLAQTAGTYVPAVLLLHVHLLMECKLIMLSDPCFPFSVLQY